MGAADRHANLYRPAASEAECRTIARDFFAKAIAEPDPSRREDLLVRGEVWMTRCRLWRPANGETRGAALKA